MTQMEQKREPTYWETQRALGTKYEKEQDSILRRWFHIKEAEPDEDKLRGVDRILYPDDSENSGLVVPFPIPVQYKGDQWTWTTENVCVEYISNDEKGSLGGWLSSHAAWISSYDTRNRICHILDAARLRAHFGVWWCHPIHGEKQGFKRVPRNQKEWSWKTWNLLVPISHLADAHIGSISENGSFVNWPMI